ncbi:hypothetical protein DSO57_1029795 [Entomophthora muscae]|uniref:Uncharacterized protein n=1 Tax=Entomophthora muscae TaxID=34485 RepID=A0ACC2T1L3_9FUNG|nr:hypothetical protein DSO57_1029795 [Entomophthora muscae]
MSKVTCHCCNCKGHYTNSCTSKTGKKPSGVETGLSHSTINNLINVLTVLPDRLPQAPEGPVASLYGADHSPDKDELFVPDIGYSGNALHCVIVEDVHIVQTHSQARAKGKAQAVVSKPYTRQLLDKAPNEGPCPSTDTLHLKIINVAISMDTMKAHHPELCGSILEFLSMADNLDIHLVNKISASYSECQTISLYYCRDKNTGTHKTMPSVNLAYKNRVVPIQYQKLSHKEYKGLPLCADLPIEILAGHQVLIETGLDIDVPQGLYSELQLPRKSSCLEPLVAPGLILPGHDAVKVLLANLTQSPIRVQRHQVVAYLHLIPVEEVPGIHKFGTLEEFGLGSSDGQPPLVGALIPREKLTGLSTEQQDTAMSLFEKYKSIFAEDNFDLGCAKNTLHYIDTGDKQPI